MVHIMTRHTFKLQMTEQIADFQDGLDTVVAAVAGTSDTATALKTRLTEIHLKEERFTDADVVNLLKDINAWLTVLGAAV